METREKGREEDTMQILSVLSCPLLPPLAIQQLCLIHKGLIAITAAPPLPGFCVKSFRHLFFFFNVSHDFHLKTGCLYYCRKNHPYLSALQLDFGAVLM